MRACIYTKCLCFPHMLFYIFTMCRYVCVREREKKKKKGTRWWFSLNKLLTSFVLFSFYAFFSVLDIYFFKDPSRQRTSKKIKTFLLFSLCFFLPNGLLSSSSFYACSKQNNGHDRLNKKVTNINVRCEWYFIRSLEFNERSFCSQKVKCDHRTIFLLDLFI